MKIVITGGAGFIGSHIAEYWSDKAQVTVIDNLRTGYTENLKHLPDVDFIEGDIRDKYLVDKVAKGAKYIFNLAALVSVPESIQKPEETIEINVKGLINILEAAKKYGVEKVVHSSSAAVYGDDPRQPKRTDMLPVPKTPYGITKLDGEYWCNFYSDEFGVKTTSLRYFNVFGPRQDPQSQYAAAIPIFVSRAIKNENIVIYGDGKQTRDFVYVKDVVKANVLAAESSLPKGVFNVATGRSVSILKLAEKIIDVTGSSSEIVFADPRPGDIKHSSADIIETTKTLKFKPDFDFDEGLKNTIDFFSRKYETFMDNFRRKRR
jgi:UDP-glucose 4-epimerase